MRCGDWLFEPNANLRAMRRVFSVPPHRLTAQVLAAANGNRLYVGIDHHLRVVDRRTAKVLRTYQFDRHIMDLRPVDNGPLLVRIGRVADVDESLTLTLSHHDLPIGRVVALDPRTLQRQWHIDRLHHLALHNNRLYATRIEGDGHAVFEIDANTGKIVRTHSMGHAQMVTDIHVIGRMLQGFGYHTKDGHPANNRLFYMALDLQTWKATSVPLGVGKEALGRITLLKIPARDRNAPRLLLMLPATKIDAFVTSEATIQRIARPQLDGHSWRVHSGWIVSLSRRHLRFRSTTTLKIQGQVVLADEGITLAMLKGHLLVKGFGDWYALRAGGGVEQVKRSHIKHVEFTDWVYSDPRLLIDGNPATLVQIPKGREGSFTRLTVTLKRPMLVAGVTLVGADRSHKKLERVHSISINAARRELVSDRKAKPDERQGVLPPGTRWHIGRLPAVIRSLQIRVGCQHRHKDKAFCALGEVVFGPPSNERRRP